MINRPYTISGMTANEAYDFLNKEYFKGQLPKVPVKWPRAPRGKKLHYIGRTVGGTESGPERILLNPQYANCSRVWGLTLFHEMVHVEQWFTVPFRYEHGPRFRARMKELAAKGAFDGLW